MATSPGYIRLATSAPRSLFETAFDAIWDPVVGGVARLAHVPIVLANAAAHLEFERETTEDSLIESSVYALLAPESVSTVQSVLEGSSDAVARARTALSWRFAAGIRGLPTEIQCLECAPGQRLLMLTLRLPVGEMAEASAGLGNWEYRFDGDKLTLAPEIHRLLAVGPDRLIPTLCAVRDLCQPESLQRFESAYARALEVDGRFDLELELHTLTHQRRWVRLVGQVELRDGRPIRAWGSLQDIQAEKAARFALETNVRWLRQSMAMSCTHAWRWYKANDALEFAPDEHRSDELSALFPSLEKLLTRVHPRDRTRVGRLLDSAFSERREVQDEFRLKMQGGRYRWFDSRARPFFDAAGEPLGLIGVAQDITERHESQARVRESEALLQTTTANTADTLVLLGVDLKVRFVNKGFRGLSVEQILGRDVGILLPESARLVVVDRLRWLLKTGEEAIFEFDLGAEGTGPRYFENRAVLVKDARIGTGISLTLSEITDRKRLEKEILDVSSRERHSIGRDLHDGLGQELTGVALMLRGLAMRLRRQAPESVVYVDEVVALVNQSIETTRSLARGLLPVCTKSGGLPFALEELASRSRIRYGFDVRFRAEIWPALTLSERDASHLYRIAQEALTNAARHAKPTSVEIFLLVTHSTFLLSISDDGVGICNAAGSDAGMGLKIMRYRASMVGAKFDILQQSPCGTVIRVHGEQPLPPIAL